MNRNFMRSGVRFCQLHLVRLTGVAAFAIATVTMGSGIVGMAQQAAPPPSPAAAGQAAPAQSAAAQDIAGIWQGTLHIPKTDQHPQMDLRLVVKVSKTDAGALKAVWYSIDQGAQSVPMATITFQDGVLKFKSAMVDRSYEGRMSEDGKSITGTWMEGSIPISLPLERATTDTAWAIPEPPKPMAADADPSFEVATIKPNDSGATQMQGLVIRGRQFLTKASALQDLISFAYNVQSKQIVNGPDWINSDRYDIEALPDAEGVPNSHQIMVMIQKLMADRFQLKFHHEQREMSAYVLEVSKNGQKMTVNESKGQLPGLGFGPGTGGITLRAMNATMGDLTGFLQVLVLDRPVVDKTGLTGRYDLRCTFTPDDSQFNGHPPRLPSPPAADGAQASTPEVAAAPSLYEAMDQQLGLKLTAEKTMVDVIVIDHVEKPSPN
jgi:uncharacterized protein (TIGR03435 family)